MPSFRNGHTLKTTKGYPRITAGPLRGQYIHRVVAEAMLGRKLARDEEIHHRDGDKLNFHPSNIIVRGHKDHGWVSAKQAWFMREKDGKLKQEWDEFMAARDEEQQVEVAVARAGQA